MDFEISSLACTLLEHGGGGTDIILVKRFKPALHIFEKSNCHLKGTTALISHIFLVMLTTYHMYGKTFVAAFSSVRGYDCMMCNGCWLG